jgi:pimeloyl-ACP methyl ester carboxylesterase
MAQVVEESLKVPSHVWRSTLRSLLDQDSTALPDRIEAPTCIIWGDQDGLTLRPEQQALVSAIRKSTLVVYEGAGHAPHWEAPDQIAGEVAAWMRQTLDRAA